jgi:hypothetical protein
MKDGLGIFRTYRRSWLPLAQPRALPGARLCCRSAALLGCALRRGQESTTIQVDLFTYYAREKIFASGTVSSTCFTKCG